MIKFLRFISWLLYMASISIFILNFYTLEYSRFGGLLLIISMLVLIGVGGFLLTISKKKLEIEDKNILNCGFNNRILGGLCFIIGGCCVIMVIISLLNIFVYGGQPTIIDGVYCIPTRTGHNIEKVLTIEEYNWLYFLNEQLFASGAVLLNAVFLSNSNFREIKNY